jgi:hypothetical protein
LAIQEQLVHKEQQVQLVTLDQLVHKVLLETQGLLDHKEILVPQVLLEILEQQDLKETQVNIDFQRTKPLLLLFYIF